MNLCPCPLYHWPYFFPHLTLMRIPVLPLSNTAWQIARHRMPVPYSSLPPPMFFPTRTVSDIRHRGLDSDVLSDTEQCQTYVTGVLTPRSTLWVAPSPSLLAAWTIFNTPEPCSISGAPVWHLVKHGTPFHSDLRRVWTESDCVCRGVAGCSHCPSAGLLRYPFRMRHLIICPSLSPLLYGLLYNLRED